MKGFTLCIACIVCISVSAQTDTVIRGKIPIDPNNWYQLNNVSNGLQQLFDGDLYTRPNTGWGKVLGNYDSYYPVPAGMQLEIDSIKLFDWEGTMDDYPATFYVISGNNWQRKPLATFTGDRYNAWDGPYPARPDVYALDTPITDVKYIVLNAWYEYPTEVEFYGSYKPATPVSPAVKKYQPLSNYTGVNAFEWDFEGPANPTVIDSVRMKAIKSFGGVRHYMDWQKLESNEGKYTFNPVHSGGWNYDTIYARCKQEGITILADLKTLPDWFLDSYPADQRDGENVPVEYGADFSSPASYIKQAKVAFQYAARYGSNKNITAALVTVDTSQRWTGDPQNVVKTGLNLVKYIECDNERDKWWKGRNAYQTGREYAANLSAFYDGHKKTLGANVGVKNADPNMQVVMCGIASASTDYVRGMIDWCKEFRGYKANGQPDLCWDVVNYHLYANDARNAANVWPTTGVAPEVSINDSVANAFIQMVHEYAADMPVWLTEGGYDIAQTSPDKAPPIGNKTALETQGDWIIRTALTYARSGLQRVFFYELIDDNPYSGGPYASSGLANSDYSRRPAADYLWQVKSYYGNYIYQTTKQTYPVVDKYALPSGIKMLAFWLPTQNGNSINYTLDVENADSVYYCTLRKGIDKLACQLILPANGYITVPVTETPSFAGLRYKTQSLVFNGAPTGTASAKLQWQVLNDAFINHYTIERSADGSGFTPIGALAANKANPDNNAYTFDDAAPVTGVNYYRLKQVGADSSASYSQTIAIQFDRPITGLSVYPNPAKQHITIHGLPGTANTMVSLIGNDGKVIATKITSGNSCSFSLGSYATGVYFVNVKAGTQKATLKFVKE